MNVLILVMALLGFIGVNICQAENEEFQYTIPEPSAFTATADTAQVTADTAQVNQ